jgi:hypothetical protein
MSDAASCACLTKFVHIVSSSMFDAFVQSTLLAIVLAVCVVAHYLLLIISVHIRRL